MRIPREIFKIGDEVVVINSLLLPGKVICPDLSSGQNKSVVGICVDRYGNQHIDVGLVSELNYVTSYETGEDLPGGDKIHWCHPSRFTKKVV